MIGRGDSLQFDYHISMYCTNYSAFDSNCIVLSISIFRVKFMSPPKKLFLDSRLGLSLYLDAMLLTISLDLFQDGTWDYLWINPQFTAHAFTWTCLPVPVRIRRLFWPSETNPKLLWQRIETTFRKFELTFLACWNGETTLPPVQWSFDRVFVTSCLHKYGCCYDNLYKTAILLFLDFACSA